MTAESRCRASTPCEMYMAMMPPETWAMPLVMMVMSSLRVALERNGRMVSGASVWPMKMLAATFMLSAPRDAHGFEHDPGHAANDDLHEPDVIKHREECGDEDDGGQNLKGEDGAGTGWKQVAECAGIGQAELAEQHSGARKGGGEHVVDNVAGPGS